MMDCGSDIVGEKDFIIIEKGAGRYIHCMSNPYFHINNYKIEMSTVIGKPYWSTFRIIIKETDHNKAVSCLEYCKPEDVAIDLTLLQNQPHCEDNRLIIDDCNSQSMTNEDIENLKKIGVTSNEIIKQLIANSSSFTKKTAFSQEKYLLRKRKRHADWILVKKPSIRLISDVFYREVDRNRSFDIRPDTLARILTTVNFHPNGKYIVFERDLKGLVGASMLNRLSQEGTMINVTLDANSMFHNSMSARVMRFSHEMLARVVDVPLVMLNNQSPGNSMMTMDKQKQKAEKTVLFSSSSLDSDITYILPGSSILSSPHTDAGMTMTPLYSSSSESDVILSSYLSSPPNSDLPNGELSVKSSSVSVISDMADGVMTTWPSSSLLESEIANVLTPPTSSFESGSDGDTATPPSTLFESDESTPSSLWSESDSANETMAGTETPFKKKGRRTEESLARARKRQLMLDQLREKKADGIIIACKRYHREVLELLIPYLAISRTFVVYCPFREPLGALFETLSGRSDIVNIHLTEGWLRRYQVLRERTHPLVTMSSKSGYLLSGMVVDPKRD